MRIGILSQWFDPEPGPARLPGALARSLAARGHQVRVLTGFPNYPDGVLRDGYQLRLRTDESAGPLEIRRVALYPSHDASVVRRAANYASFATTAAVVGAPFLKGLDALWVYNSPITVALPLWRIARRMKVPALVHVMDLWPDNVVSSGFARSPRAESVLTTAGHWWSSWMYGAASHIAAISPGVVDVLASRGVPRDKLSYIPLWADENAFRPSDDQSFRRDRRVADDRLVVLYGGALGHNQAIDLLIEGCGRYPTDAPPIDVWIAGSGVEEPYLRELAGRRGNPRVRVTFLGRIPPSEMSAVMAAADLHYVGLRADHHSEMTMPSKLQATMACAKPILLAIGGDAAQAVERAGAGFTVPPGDPDAIASALARAARQGRAAMRVMGLAAREAYDRDFSLAAGTDRIEGILERLAATGRTASEARS